MHPSRKSTGVYFSLQGAHFVPCPQAARRAILQVQVLQFVAGLFRGGTPNIRFSPSYATLDRAEQKLKGKEAGTFRGEAIASCSF